MGIQQGQFVEVRARPWLVEAVDDSSPISPRFLSPKKTTCCLNFPSALSTLIAAQAVEVFMMASQ
jgi:hypothetical protein